MTEKQKKFFPGKEDKARPCLTLATMMRQLFNVMERSFLGRVKYCIPAGICAASKSTGNGLMNSGRCKMVVVGRKGSVALFVPSFPDLAGAENGICSL